MPVELASGISVELNDEDAHYLRSVLRLKEGCEVRVFNGRGGEFDAKLLEVTRKKVTLEVGKWFDKKSEPDREVTIGLALLKSERMDFAIQKAVELGVSSVTPLVSERCAVQVREERRANRQRHWQGVARAASEQSGRVVVPEINEAMALADWMAATSVSNRFFFHPRAEQKLAQSEVVSGAVSLLIGPEGGFSQGECDRAVQVGFRPVTLGPRVLRAETACVAAMTAVQLLWGDL